MCDIMLVYDLYSKRFGFCTRSDVPVIKAQQYHNNAHYKAYYPYTKRFPVSHLSPSLRKYFALFTAVARNEQSVLIVLIDEKESEQNILFIPLFKIKMSNLLERHSDTLSFYHILYMMSIGMMLKYTAWYLAHLH